MKTKDIKHGKHRRHAKEVGSAVVANGSVSVSVIAVSEEFLWFHCDNLQGELLNNAIILHVQRFSSFGRLEGDGLAEKCLHSSVAVCAAGMLPRKKRPYYEECSSRKSHDKTRQINVPERASAGFVRMVLLFSILSTSSTYSAFIELPHVLRSQNGVTLDMFFFVEANLASTKPQEEGYQHVLTYCAIS